MGDKEEIKEFYGKRLTSSDDLEATAVTSCSRQVNQPCFVKAALNNIHEEIKKRSYGCATEYPEALVGAKILDLGSGCGRDCFVLSKLVGEEGEVVGLDMTNELLTISRDYICYHTELYNYSKPNVSFVKGDLEKMGEAGLTDNFFDIIVSNCVICLCRNKAAVLKEAARILKNGGELYFSDMYREGELPEEVLNDEEMWCEGLIGSLTYLQLTDIARQNGFKTPRVVKAKDMPVLNENMKKRLGNVRYASVTYRVFKESAKEGTSSAAEVVYKGGIMGYEDQFNFDRFYTFKKDEKQNVDSEVAEILSSSRFAPFFDINPIKDTIEIPPPFDPFTLTK